MKAVRQLAGVGAFAALAVAGGWAVSTFQARQTPTGEAAAATLPATVDTRPSAATLTIPNADALPPDAGGVDGVEEVLLMVAGTPRPMPPGALFDGDELVEEQYLLAWNLNGQHVDLFRYLKRNADEGPGTYLCFTSAVGERVGGASCSLMGDPPDPSRPGSRPVGGDRFLSLVPLGSGAAYVLQVPPGTTHVVVSLRPVSGSGAERRIALIPQDGTAVIVVPGSTEEMGVEVTAWEGPTLLASDRP